jgi:hypothetical protein
LVLQPDIEVREILTAPVAVTLLGWHCFLVHTVREKQTAMKEEEEEDIQKKRERNDSLNQREDKRLPGEYPPSEDIMNRLNDVERVNIDLDDLGNSKSAGAIPDRMESPFPEDKEVTVTGPSDLTKEDYEALGPRDLSLDGGDDEQLKHRTWPVDFSARDLDVPDGSTGKTDAMDQGDEENTHYSLGGDDKDNLEDDQTRTF